MTGRSLAAICLAGLAGIAAANGCFNPKFQDAMPCSGIGDCPPGRTCAHEVCVACQAVEFCDGSVDDDCDGSVDEGCDCVDGTLKICGLEFCPGESLCVNGQWSSCEGARQPLPAEICDGVVDDDCDGSTDEFCPCQPVGVIEKTNCGPCHDGEQLCTPSGLGECQNESPRIECCKGDTRACNSCKTGTQTCTAAGRWGACNTADPIEKCNGIDDNCDGRVDEICPTCLVIPNILVHDMAPPLTGDAEFAGHGPDVTIITTYSIVGGTQVCAQVSVTMQETNGGTSLARKSGTACSAPAPGKIGAINSPNTTHMYRDDDTSAGGLWDFVTPKVGSGIGTIRCVGDTGGADICNGGANFTDCSKCEILSICPQVIYTQ